jgi:hypothetical protein
MRSMSTPRLSPLKFDVCATLVRVGMGSSNDTFQCLSTVGEWAAKSACTCEPLKAAFRAVKKTYNK